MSDLIVTIDGPGGTGKSTVSQELARRTGLPHLDTGAFYRAATLATLQSGVGIDDPVAVEEIVRHRDFRQDAGVMYLDGVDVSDAIRTDEVTSAVSVVSAHNGVRALLVEMQRAWIQEHDGSGVVEGRDIGSVVFPNARIKIYLDARPQVRAQRRAVQSGVATHEVLDELERRDHLDATRTTSPMSVPDGAIVVDTSDLTFEQVVQHLTGIVHSMS